MNIKTRLHTLRALKDSVENKINKLDKEIKDRDVHIFNMQSACLLLEKISEEEVEKGINTYIALLDEGLKAIFPEQ